MTLPAPTGDLFADTTKALELALFYAADAIGLDHRPWFAERLAAAQEAAERTATPEDIKAAVERVTELARLSPGALFRKLNSLPPAQFRRDLQAVLSRAEAAERLAGHVLDLDRDFEDTKARALSAEAALSVALGAMRLTLPLIDDDLQSFGGDIPPSLYDKRGFVCLDDLHCDHERWKVCEATPRALAAIRDLLPEAEWADAAYAETQAAVEHAHLRAASQLIAELEAKNHA
jgi:hypothetical protein